MTTLKKWKETVVLLAGLGLVLLFMEVSGIGCPIKWFTGISCAGCGMTRAVFFAVQLQFSKAFYYHPLFWMLPFLVPLFLVRERLSRKMRKGITWTVAICFVAVYLFRLLDPENAVVTIELENGFPARLWKRFT